MTRHPLTARPRRGIVLLDVLIGIILLGSLLTVLAVSTNLRNRAAARMAAQRGAVQLAEKALSDLQRGTNTQPADHAGTVAVRYSGKRIGTLEWVQITANHDGRSAALTGLAPSTQPARDGGAQ